METIDNLRRSSRGGRYGGGLRHSGHGSVHTAYGLQSSGGRDVVSNQGSNPESMTPEDYLERYGITSYLKDALGLVLQNRPQAPLEFIAEYFRNAVQGSSYLHRSYWLVRRTERGRQQFMDNIVEAYDSLCSRKGSIGVTGEELMHLVTHLCRDFPTTLTEDLMRSVHMDPMAIVPFEIFATCVQLCLVFQEYVEFAVEFFAALNRQGVLSSAIENAGEKGDEQAASFVRATACLQSAPEPALTLSSTVRVTVDDLIRAMRQDLEKAASAGGCSDSDIIAGDVLAERLCGGLQSAAEAHPMRTVSITDFVHVLISLLPEEHAAASPPKRDG